MLTPSDHEHFVSMRLAAPAPAWSCGVASLSGPQHWRVHQHCSSYVTFELRVALGRHELECRGLVLAEEHPPWPTKTGWITSSSTSRQRLFSNVSPRRPWPRIKRSLPSCCFSLVTSPS